MNLDGYLVLHPMKESEHAVSVTTSNKQISIKGEPSKKAILTKVQSNLTYSPMKRDDSNDGFFGFI
jgi:hypothetical protein